MSKTNRPIWKENTEMRQARIASEFGKFKSKSWDGKKSHKQERQEYRQKGSITE